MKKAFTLAEVLITLSILGIVAAISIPNLISHYKKVYTETRLKQAYSMLNNVIEQATIEYQGLKNVFSPTVSLEEGAAEFRDKLLPYFKITKISEPEYWGYSGTASKRIKTRKGTDWNMKFFDDSGNVDYGLQQWGYNIQLKNGMIVAYRKFMQPTFYVDIDGPDGKNRLGYDVFAFSIRPYETYYCNVAYKYPGICKGQLLGGNRGYSEVMSWYGESFGNFGKSSYIPPACSGAGYWCTTVIHKNNFKIPKDYPVKF